MASGPVPSSAVETESRLRAIEALVRDEVGTVHDGRLSEQSLNAQFAPLDIDATGVTVGDVFNSDFTVGDVSAALVGLDDKIEAPRSALYLPGTAGHTASTPDAASLDITGDIDIRCWVAMDDWTPSALQTLVGKWGTTSNQRSYRLSVNTTGFMQFSWSVDGTATSTVNSTAPGGVDGTRMWVRVTLDADDGAGGRVVTFYKSTNGVDWTTINTVTGASTSIFAGTATLAVGGRLDAEGDLAAGKFYRAQVRSGIDGTVVADWRGDDPFSPRYRDSTGKVWTVNGSAWSWVDP